MKQILNLLTMAVFLLALSACGNVEEPAAPQLPGDGDVSGIVAHGSRLSLYISLSDDVVSRAPADGQYDAGRGYENFIDLGTAPGATSDMWMALFSDSGEFLTVIDSSAYTLVPLESYNSSKHYLLEFSVPQWLKAQLDQKPFRMLMMTNCGGKYPDLSGREGPLADIPLSNINSWWGEQNYVNFTPRNVDGPEDKIPMFGVCRFSGVKLEENATVALTETLHLLRALAKIDVYDSPYTTSPLTGVELLVYSDVSIPYPNGVTHQDDYVKGSYASDYVATSKMNFSGQVKNAVIPLAKVQGADNGFGSAYRIYCPVYRNLDANGVPVTAYPRTRMRLTFADGYSKIIEFRDYDKLESDNSAYFNLNRNYWYKFEVTNRTISVDVLPYGVVDLNPGFGLD